MNTVKKLLSLVIMMSILTCVSLPANAVTSTLYVSAGSTAYSTETSKTTKTRKTCHIALTFVQFSNYPQNSIPSGYYVYAALCPYLSTSDATDTAGFSMVSSSGYYYNYHSGQGGNDQRYRLKTYSNLNIYYSATFDWTANGQAAS
ncbi:MAG: hypothetical protein IK020_10950 [Clostridiales bacterium]|nr:hypothetical protein [Clostridiales bacterium]